MLMIDVGDKFEMLVTILMIEITNITIAWATAVNFHKHFEEI